MINSLAAMYPEPVRELSNKNFLITPDKITFSSNKIVWWKAVCGHEWQTIVKSHSGGENYPVRSRVRIVEGDSERTWSQGYFNHV